jgi:hypothetical protein
LTDVLTCRTARDPKRPLEGRDVLPADMPRLHGAGRPTSWRYLTGWIITAAAS